MGMNIESALEYLKDFDSYTPYQEAINKVSDWIELFQVNYEARLKADMVAMLAEIKNDLAKLKSYESVDGQDLVMLADIGIYFDKKISELEGEAPTKSCDTCRNKGSNNGVCNICHSRRKYGCWTPIGGWK